MVRGRSASIRIVRFFPENKKHFNYELPLVRCLVYCRDYLTCDLDLNRVEVTVVDLTIAEHRRDRIVSDIKTDPVKKYSKILDINCWSKIAVLSQLQKHSFSAPNSAAKDFDCHMLIITLVQHHPLVPVRRHHDCDVDVTCDVEAGKLCEGVAIDETDAPQFLALLSVISGRTSADVLVRVARLVAQSSVLTVVALAGARLWVFDGTLRSHFTVATFESSHTLTRVAVDGVDTLRFVLTQTVHTIIDVQLTVLPTEARPTLAPATTQHHTALTSPNII